MEIPIKTLSRLEDGGDIKNGALVFVIRRAHAAGEYLVTTIEQTEAGLNMPDYAGCIGKNVERAVRGVEGTHDV